LILWIKFPICSTILCAPIPTIFSQISQHGDFMVILLESSTQWREPLGGTLFALIHFCVLHPTITTHPTFVFPLLTDDMHIVGPTSNVVHVFL